MVKCGTEQNLDIPEIESLTRKSPSSSYSNDFCERGRCPNPSNWDDESSAFSEYSHTIFVCCLELSLVQHFLNTLHWPREKSETGWAPRCLHAFEILNEAARQCRKGWQMFLVAQQEHLIQQGDKYARRGNPVVSLYKQPQHFRYANLCRRTALTKITILKRTDLNREKCYKIHRQEKCIWKEGKQQGLDCLSKPVFPPKNELKMVTRSLLQWSLAPCGKGSQTVDLVLQSSSYPGS